MLHLRWVVLCMAVWAAGCGGTFTVPSGCVEAGCPCVQEGDCATGFTCTAGQCAALGSCSPVTPNGTCPAGRTCSAGVCATSDWCKDCGADQGCDDGVCVDRNGSNACSESNPTGLCQMTQVCLQGVCTDITSNNACSEALPTGLCSDGAACRDGVCVPISEDACGPGNLDGLCGSGLQCVAPGSCQQPACSPSTLFGYCADGSFCSLAGHCIADGTCDIDGDCGNKYICDDQSCLRDFSCSTSVNCLSGEHCAQTGQCIPLGTCITVAECDDGQRCSSAGTCVAGNTCDDDQDCTPPETCGSAGICLSPDACSTLNDCPPGHSCLSSTCVPSGSLCTEVSGTPDECSVGETCCALGQRCSSAGSCIPVGTCVTDADCLLGHQTCADNYTCEATTTCTGIGDCGAGEQCAETGACIPTENCLIDLDCAEGEICSALFECVPNDSCGTTEFQTTLVKPNMLVILDRSGSMNQCVGDAEDENTRWEQALIAINQVVADNSDKVRFGLSTYPAMCPGTSRDDSSCNNTDQNGCPQCNGSNQGTAQCPTPSSNGDNRTPGKVDIAIGENTGAGIASSLASNFPGGRTPTGPTLRNVRNNIASFGLPSASDSELRGNYILLITDGEPNEDPDCDNDGRCVNGALEQLKALTPSVQTFVVGFAFGSVSGNLNCNAVYGGTSLCGNSVTANNCSGSGTTRQCTCSGSSSTACYYDAGNAAALTTKFEEIVGQVASCTYSLDGEPPDINRLYVFLDYGSGDPVSIPRGAGTWDYNDVTNQVSLFGDTCDDVQNGDATPQVIYGCPDGGG